LSILSLIFWTKTINQVVITCEIQPILLPLSLVQLQAKLTLPNPSPVPISHFHYSSS